MWYDAALHNLQIISDGVATRLKAEILISGATITGIVDEQSMPADAKKIDLSGAFIAPEVLDLQVYGGSDKMFGSIPSTAALERMENDFLPQGTTGFFATVATNTNDIVEKVVKLQKLF